MNQQVKDKIWKDESGRNVPVDYVSPSARLRERHAATIEREALRISNILTSFKAKVEALCDEVFDKTISELNTEAVNSKGNFTWFNFDRSIKIEVSVKERIDFDDITITACKEKLDEFLDQNLDAKQEFIKEMVTDAFSTSRGKLDAKKVLSLMRYKSKIKHPLFQQAMDLLGESIRRPDQRRYFRVWSRNEKTGEYEAINLNFSAI